MTMRVVATFTACLFLASPSAGLTSRIICPDINLEPVEWVQKQFELADVVFLGTVSATEGPSLTLTELLEANHAEATPIEVGTMKDFLEKLKTSNGDTHKLYQTASVVVEKSWKGVTQSPIAVKNDGVPGMYGFLLMKDESYLIFGRSLEDGSYSLSTLCGDTLPAENAAERVKILDELTAAP